MGIVGTASERQQTHPPARADELADVVLPDQDGAEHRLGDYWEDGPALLIWLRHYG